MTSDVPQRGLPQFCPMCGGSLTGLSDFGESVTCRACGTLVSSGHGPRWFADPEAARQKVRPPAIGLMISGGLFILSGMAMPAFIAVAVLSNDVPQDQEAIFMALFFGATSLLTLAVGGTMIFGGYRMYHLTSWTLALISSITATASILSCCIFSIFGIFALPAFPVGIWAFIVLNDPNVKASFARSPVRQGVIEAADPL